MPPVAACPASPRPLRFDRAEWSGAFGDLGTDLPLLAGMILASGADPARVLVLFGIMQVFSAAVYRLPMAVQPLKAVAVIVIAQRTPPELIFGAGLAIGAVMLFLTATGLLDWIARVVPRPVVRGIQLGLALNLALIAFARYLPAEGLAGWPLAAAGVALAVFLLRRRRFPASLAVLALGAAWALFSHGGAIFARGDAAPPAAIFSWPSWAAIAQGFVLLALPQIPLSIGNSVLATRQLAADWFPEARIGVRRIGLTYSLMNLLAAPLGGLPVCHGSGGLAGHYAFGGRTGGSVIIYGAFMIALGLAFGAGFGSVMLLFPLPILGVILLFESFALLRVAADQLASRRALAVVALVAICAVALPYGFLVGILAGTLLHAALARQAPRLRHD